MIMYLTIASLYASKPSKIPSSPKVGQELYEQYCAGCHGTVGEEDQGKEDQGKEDQGKKDKEKDNLEISEESKDQQIEDSNAKNTNEQTGQSNSKKITSLDTNPLLSKQSLSSPIELKDPKEVPSLFDRSYSESEWITWVLLGEGMMPSYSEILHSTDAIKIKIYLDGL